MELFIDDKLGKISYQIEKSGTSDPILILAHGAGAGMDHPFMKHLSSEISKRGINVVRFNFPYIEQSRKAPGSPKHAIKTWEQIIARIKEEHKNIPLFISGKSYGGRMASHLLAAQPELKVRGIIYFGFPLHAPGRDSKERASHLTSVQIPQLFIQGTKDKLANFEMINEVVDTLASAKIHKIESGDHSFKVPKSIGNQETLIAEIAEESVKWIKSILDN